MKIYKFYSVRNLADDWRDPDEIVYRDEFYSTSIQKMEKHVLKFLKSRHSGIELPKEIELDNKGKWSFDIFGSYMPTYYVEEIKCK